MTTTKSIEELMFGNPDHEISILGVHNLANNTHKRSSTEDQAHSLTSALVVNIIAQARTRRWSKRKIVAYLHKHAEVPTGFSSRGNLRRNAGGMNAVYDECIKRCAFDPMTIQHLDQAIADGTIPDYLKL